MIPDQKPSEAVAYGGAASSHCPAPARYSPPVAAAPSTVAMASSLRRVPPRSAMVPRIGASSAIARLARPLVSPRRKVLTEASTPAFQNCLKNTGKNPAMTVVAKAELAQS